MSQEDLEILLSFFKALSNDSNPSKGSTSGPATSNNLSVWGKVPLTSNWALSARSSWSNTPPSLHKPTPNFPAELGTRRPSTMVFSTEQLMATTMPQWKRTPQFPPPSPSPSPGRPGGRLRRGAWG